MSEETALSSFGGITTRVGGTGRPYGWPIVRALLKRSGYDTETDFGRWLVTALERATERLLDTEGWDKESALALLDETGYEAMADAALATLQAEGSKSLEDMFRWEKERVVGKTT